MARILERYVRANIFELSDEALIDMCPDNIHICYSFNSYRNDLKYLNELVSAVKAEYPDMSEADMTVWYIGSNQSNRHAGYTVLFVPVPTKDYLKMKATNQCTIL